VVGQVSGQARIYGWLWCSAGLILCWFLLGIGSASSETHPKESRASTARPDLIFVLAPTVVPGGLTQRFPQGSRLVRLNSTATPDSVVNLTPEFFSAADPEMDFDGAKVLFSGQRNQSEHWQIWEMNADGSNKRQLTQCREDCLRGAYLPAEEIVFTVATVIRAREESYLAVAKNDGAEMHRITFSSVAFRLETVLRDGRILASAPWPLLGGSNKALQRLLYTVRPDGTGLDSFRCEHKQPTIQAEAAELDDGSVAFVRNARSGTVPGGELMEIRRGALKESPLGDHEASVLSVRQISAEDLVVAKERPGSSGSAARFDLYTLRLDGGRLGARIFSDAQLSSLQAVPVAAHAVPKRFWSTLNMEAKTGYFISLDSYASVDAPKGRPDSPIARVRVFISNDASGSGRLLGQAPVEADGSFYVEVPANEPIRFELVDAKGELIRAERSWVWTRPGEQRGCTGCHGDKAAAPENRWPLTLKRFDTPTPLGEIEHGTATSKAK
jgi:hypothetical protein